MKSVQADIKRWLKSNQTRKLDFFFHGLERGLKIKRIKLQMQSGYLFRFGSSLNFFISMIKLLDFALKNAHFTSWTKTDGLSDLNQDTLDQDQVITDQDLSA